MNSNYYLNLMTDYRNKISAVTKEREIYDKLLIKLRKLSEALPQAYTSLVDAEKKFKDGGFISEGEVYGNGVLKECYDALQSDIDSLNIVIGNIARKNDNLQSDISSYRRSYDSASNNYRISVQNEK